MSLNPRIDASHPDDLYLVWDKDPHADGYVLIASNGARVQVGKRANTEDAPQGRARIGNPPQPFTVQVAPTYAQSFESATYPTPPEPPLTDRVLPKYGVCPGHAAKTWSDGLHAAVLDKMKELAQGKQFLWRVEAYAADAQLDRDVNRCLNAGLTPYLCLGGTDRTNSPAVPAYVAQIAAKYKGKNVIYTGPNEPDLNGWTAQNLALRCRGIYHTIRDIDPDALIGYGAIWKGTPNSFANWQPYVTQAATVCHDEFLDGMFFPFHAYDDPAQATAANADWNMWTWYFDHFGQHKGQTAEAIFRNAGLSQVLWVNDESGGQNTDPTFTQKCLRLLQQAKDGVCHSSTIYCVLPDVPGYNYLLNTDLSERPSFEPIKQFMANA